MCVCVCVCVCVCPVCVLCVLCFTYCVLCVTMWVAVPLSPLPLSPITQGILRPNTYRVNTCKRSACRHTLCSCAGCAAMRQRLVEAFHGAAPCIRTLCKYRLAKQHAHTCCMLMRVRCTNVRLSGLLEVRSWTDVMCTFQISLSLSLSLSLSIYNYFIQMVL